MLYVIHGIDAHDSKEKRRLQYPQHRAHIADAEKANVKIVMSGPLTAADNDTAIGSLIVCEATNYETVEAFHYSDPFYKTGVWEKTSIHPFKKIHG